MTEQPTNSPWEAVDKLETLSEQPTKPSRATEGKNICVIEPKTKDKNSEVAGQPLEQPNTELLIVKTIQSLMDVIEHNLSKLQKAVE